jgi:hypothetical protein
MSQFDNLRKAAEDQLDKHGDKVEGLSDQGLEKAGDAADSATGGKFSDQIDQGQERADDAIGGNDAGLDTGSGDSGAGGAGGAGGHGSDAGGHGSDAGNTSESDSAFGGGGEEPSGDTESL